MYIILGFLILTVLGCVYSSLHDRSISRIERDNQEKQSFVEKKHKEILAEIDECPNALVRRERKAQLETMIHSSLKKANDINYSPKDIKEVTTPAERRARREAERAGRKYVHTLTRKQAEEIADEMVADFITRTGGTRNDYVRNFPPLGDALAETYAKWCDIDIRDARFAVDQIQSALNTNKLINDIEMIPVESSSVRSIGYNPETETLYVAFASGGTYEYYHVPAKVYESFMASPSKGRFVNNILTIMYNYRAI